MKPEFLINRQGKTFVLYAGLLDLAHEKGLQSIDTQAITVTATVALFKATVTLADGRVFVGHADATPDNVGRNIAPHFIRMAETRAKARALRDALNIGAASLEELGGDEEAPAPTVPRAITPARREPEGPQAQAPLPDLPAARRAEALEWAQKCRAAGIKTVDPHPQATEIALDSYIASHKRMLTNRPAGV